MKCAFRNKSRLRTDGGACCGHGGEKPERNKRSKLISAEWLARREYPGHTSKRRPPLCGMADPQAAGGGRAPERCFSRASATGAGCMSVAGSMFPEEMEEHEHPARRASMHIRAERRQLCADRAAEAGSSSWAAEDERATPGSDRSPIDRVPCCRLILPVKENFKSRRRSPRPPRPSPARGSVALAVSG